MSLSFAMESIPLEPLFAVAILIVLLMGAAAIAFLLRRASSVMTNAREKQNDAMSRYEKSVALQQEGIEIARESLALQRETNRLLTELLARNATPNL